MMNMPLRCTFAWQPRCRGVTDEREAQQLGLPAHNLQPGFTLSGLGALAEASLTCDRMVQF